MKHAWLAGAVTTVSCLFGSIVTGQQLDSPARSDEHTPKSVHQGESASPTVVSTGNFVGLAHETSGKASIYATQDGKRILRLEQFKTSNGPDVRVYLVKGSDASDSATIKAGGFVDLGALKGNVGDQNYTIPDGVNLSEFRSVSIWCRRFAVNFGAAPLEHPKGPN